MELIELAEKKRDWRENKTAEEKYQNLTVYRSEESTRKRCGGSREEVGRNQTAVMRSVLALDKNVFQEERENICC